MDTLLLSAWFEPLARISWRRAMTLVFAGKVEVVDEYPDRLVRTVTLELKMPSVVRFLRALRGKRKGVKFSRENVYLRDGGRCQYCGVRVARSEATYDHVVPRARGGRTSWENIVIACVACNHAKGNRTPAEAGYVLRSKPERPKRLPDTLRLTFTVHDGIPESWRTWLRDFQYWNGELDSDG